MKWLAESLVRAHHQRSKPRLGNPEWPEQKALRLRLNKSLMVNGLPRRHSGKGIHLPKQVMREMWV